MYRQSRNQTRRPVATAAAGALLALLAVQTPVLDARERTAAAQRPARPVAQRPQPARPPVTRSTETQRTDTGYVRSTTITRADGATATRQRTVSHDREAGTRSVDVTRTGFDGRTRSMSRDNQRTADGFTRVTTVTTERGEGG